ncbi:MAG: hypothetical protein ACE15C_09060 [Phycisphaerae bacterium]
MAAQLRPKVGLLGLTLELYETLAPSLRGRREQWLRRDILPALANAGVDVIFDRAVFKREEIDSAVARFETAGADAILVILLTYSPSQLALPALKRTRLPILVWNTQELYAVDAAFTSQAMIDNHGVHGTQDLANVLLRSGVKFRYVTSHVRDEGAMDVLRDFFIAAAVARKVRSARLGLLGYPFPGMGDFALDTTQLVATLGCQWTALSVEEYVRRAADASPKAVTALVAEYRDAYAVAPDVTEADLDATARVEIALRTMAAGRGLDALTYQFTAFGEDERTPTVPFVAASRMMADGIGFGGEGDLVSAIGTAMLNWLCPPASFAEMFTIDFAGNAVFMSHMGEANVAMARKDRKVALAARPTPITRTRQRQLALVTTFEPGLATFFALTQSCPHGSHWNFITAPAVIEDYGPLDMDVPHFKMKVGDDVRRFLTAYAKAGGPHHCAVCFGEASRRIRDLAEILGGEYRPCTSD